MGADTASTAPSVPTSSVVLRRRDTALPPVNEAERHTAITKHHRKELLVAAGGDPAKMKGLRVGRETKIRPTALYKYVKTDADGVIKLYKTQVAAKSFVDMWAVLSATKALDAPSYNALYKRFRRGTCFTIGEDKFFLFDVEPTESLVRKFRVGVRSVKVDL